ncbi:C-C motif chemokine 4 homolog isoform X2 [Hoplias malabaricus]|uniref:C-C motif chemokine 4 homolog isoform X2 n=1 Tax=Hoplias malabaricus TaxID=27720 RepID=UPI0034637C45
MPKFYCAFLLGSLVLICLQSYTAGQSGKSPEECCFKFYNKPIPIKSISVYEETRFECPKAGVVFITNKGLRICVDPNFKWVKRAIDQIDLRVLEGSTSD